MEIKKNKSLSVSLSIQLLFDNEKLDLMKVLCLMFSFSKQSNKRRKVSEILFYYSLVNFDLIKLFEEEMEKQNEFSPSPNLYFRFQRKINEILLNLSHLQFVELSGDISNKLDDIKVKLKPAGKKFFEEHNSEYFGDLQEKYISVLDEVSFSAENVKVIKGVQQ
jgi:hypothetical protein